MGKYIDAERLKAEIRHLKIDVYDEAHQFDIGARSSLTFLESFIASLQQDHLPDAGKMVEQEHIADVSKMMEQQEVDLEKEYQEFCKDYPFPWSSQYLNREYIDELCLSVARHFYGLRNRALEEAARHIYESWMGGTMDDVRRDMVELGKVLNARKEG